MVASGVIKAGWHALVPAKFLELLLKGDEVKQAWQGSLGGDESRPAGQNL
jgi:hypothetical protein